VDQLEVVSDGEGSQLATPEDGEEDLGIGSLVEVVLKESASSSHTFKPLFGVIRWIGTVPGDKKESRLVAGIEMEDLEDGLSDGTLKGKRYFSCPLGKALFVPLARCAKDRRFQEALNSNPRASLGRRLSKAFGSVECQPVVGSVPPLKNVEEVRAMFGKNKG
ncbi:UNVERIFIED_CONTAM: hypothetical protein GTU68_024120, partial [Idotea baltica]|nr:hypothetical protein [Idotea baltica]